jgi:hypothetical protein
VDDKTNKLLGEPAPLNAILKRVAGGKQRSILSQLFDFQNTTTLMGLQILNL